MTIRGETVAARDHRDIASPIDLDQRDFLLVEPREHVKSNAATAVQHDDARWKVGIGFEVAVGFLLLRIVGKAVADKERAASLRSTAAVGPLAGRVETPRFRCASRRLQGAAEAIARPLRGPASRP